ncbi:MAG: Ig-like domain-containing protein, partial [Polyangiales bacterium]
MTHWTNLSLRAASLFLVLGAAACGDNLAGLDARPVADGDLGSDGSDGSTTLQPPRVTSTSPFDAAVGVPLNARMSANFDLAMTPLTNVTFTLATGGTAVSGVVSNAPGG